MNSTTAHGWSGEAADKTPGGSKLPIVIVGAGSAGAVLASRLTENPTRSVVLLDAGQDFEPEQYPIALTDAGIVASPEFDWKYASDDEKKLGHNVPSPRGKVVGGSSAVNGTVAVRARPSDFQRWTSQGVEGWTWDDVLPVFKALENTPTGDDRWHGRNGPFPIRQRVLEELTPSARAFIDATLAHGLPPVDDFNGDRVEGVGPYSLNVVNEVRMNTGMTYLLANVRQRANLTIRGGAEVDRLVFENRRVVGVLLVDGELLQASEVILSGGTFGSPAILMRSGIGPADHLRGLGIEMVANLPVGKKLKDHPFYYSVFALKTDQNSMRPAAGSLAWFASKKAAAGDLDLQISATHFFDPKNSPTGGAIVLASGITLPMSVGSFQLSSRDPRDPPQIQYNYFDDQSDLDRMVEVVELTRRIAKTEPFAGMVESELFPGREIPELQLRDHIVASVATYAHPTSTVPMGAADDPEAVVDNWGRVRGVFGVHVVDASIFPDVPSVPTNVTTIMVAERIASRLNTIL